MIRSFVDLGHQLDSLREQLQKPQQKTVINYEPMKAALLSLWGMAPEEIKTWFLEFVMKDSENAGSSSPATVN